MAKRATTTTASAGEPRRVQASTFKATCLELMDDVAAGRSELIVTKHGRPIVRIGPVDDVAPSPFGFLRGTVSGHDALIGPDDATWLPSTTDPLVANTGPRPKRRRGTR